MSSARVSHALKGLSALALACACVCTLLILAGCSGTQDVAAKYGDKTISEQEVTDYTASFRSQSGYGDDQDWANYLSSQGLTTKTWREQVIQGIVQKQLVKDKADELGITADENQVDQQIESDKESAGGEDAYQQSLSEQGTDEQSQREAYEYTSIQQQVISKETQMDESQSDDAVQSYIDNNLASRVLRHYELLSYGTDQKSQAQSDLAKLKELKGAQLQEAFETMANQRAADSSNTGFNGDAGWDFDYALEDNEKPIELKAEELYPKLLVTDDECQIVLCLNKVNFEGGLKIADITDEGLLEAIKQESILDNWSSVASDYLNSLVESANVQVKEMPEGLPYNVDSLIGDTVAAENDTAD